MTRDDLTAEGWLVVAILLPELALLGRLSQVIAKIDPTADFLLEELFHCLPEAETDKLWPLLLRHPAFGDWVMQRQVAGIPHRLDQLAAYFCETLNRECQRWILEFFCSQTHARLGSLVRGALPYVLKLGIHVIGVDGLLNAGLRGLADVAEMDDLTLIERCSPRCPSDESRAALETCRRAVWKRAGIDLAGLMSVVEAPDELGGLSVVTAQGGELSSAPAGSKPDDDAEC